MKIAELLEKEKASSAEYVLEHEHYEDKIQLRDEVILKLAEALTAGIHGIERISPRHNYNYACHEMEYMIKTLTECEVLLRGGREI